MPHWCFFFFIYFFLLLVYGKLYLNENRLCRRVFIILSPNCVCALLHQQLHCGCPRRALVMRRQARSLSHLFLQITCLPHFAYPVHFCKTLEIRVFISSGAAWITRSSCLRLRRSCNQNLGMRGLRARFVPPGDSTTGANHCRKQGELFYKSGLSSTLSVWLSICWCVSGRGCMS